MQQFKIGDWVDYAGEFYRVHEEYNGKGNISKEVVNSLVRHNKNVQLWQPKEGEWCWFKDSKNTIGTLVRLVGIEEDGTYYGYTSYGMQDKAPCVEPFIGELPSFPQH